MFRIFDKINNGGVYVIAEMSSNHGGSLDNALAIVREAAKAGADCLKIQTYTADSITIDCDNEYFRAGAGLWDGRNLHDLYKEAGTPYEWHRAIKEECEKCGIDFFSTPFDPAAVDFLEDLGAEAYKIASFELKQLSITKMVMPVRARKRSYPEGSVSLLRFLMRPVTRVGTVERHQGAMTAQISPR